MTREQRTLKRLFRQLTKAKRKSFPHPRESLDAPDRQGVYIIYDPRGRVVHVGCTPRARDGIWQRLRDHMANKSSFTTKHLDDEGSRLRRGYSFQCLVVNDARYRVLLEALTIGRLCPAHIGRGSGLLRAK
jgi:hypothetical protein